MDNTLQVLNYGVSSAIPGLLVTLSASSLPLILWACVPRRGHWRASLLLAFVMTVSIILLLVLGRVTVLGVVVTLATLVYYLLALLLLFRFIAFARREELGKLVVFLVSALLFVLIPAMPLRRLHSPSMLILGWNLTLSTYSCAVELARSSEKPRFAEFLFFASVDPALSYPDRSRRTDPRAGTIVSRLFLGVLGMLAGQQMLNRWPRLLALVTTGLPLEIPEEALVVLSTIVIFFSIYWLRAGVAHIRIGLMQAIGFQPPECFNRPYLAKSPLDFWRRWNCWVGAWVKRYLFLPASLWMMRKSLAVAPRLSVDAARSAALVMSFVAMGALHDWLPWAAQGFLLLVYVRVFVFAAFGLLAWEFVEGRSNMQRVSARPPGMPLAEVASTMCRVAYISGIVILSIQLG